MAKSTGKRQARLVRALRKAGLGAVAEYPIHSGAQIAQRLDVALPDRKLAIECDGALHGKPAFGFRNSFRRQELDVLKREWLERNGWRVILFRGDIAKASASKIEEVVRLALAAELRPGVPVLVWGEHG